MTLAVASVWRMHARTVRPHRRQLAMGYAGDTLNTLWALRALTDQRPRND